MKLKIQTPLSYCEIIYIKHLIQYPAHRCSVNDTATVVTIITNMIISMPTICFSNGHEELVLGKSFGPGIA